MFCGSASLRRRPASLATLLVAPTFRPPFVCLALEIQEALDTRDKSGGSVLRRHAGTAGRALVVPFSRPSLPPPRRAAGRAPPPPPPPRGAAPPGPGAPRPRAPPGQP